MNIRIKVKIALQSPDRKLCEALGEWASSFPELALLYVIVEVAENQLCFAAMFGEGARHRGNFKQPLGHETSVIAEKLSAQGAD